MRARPRLALLCAAALLCLAPHGDAQQADSGDTSSIACRALEVHASANPAAIVVVFHQRDKEDQARLASALRQHSGESVEIQTNDGK